METKGNKKASLLSLIAAAPKTAIAICGAKPATLKTEPTTTSNAKARKRDLFSFIEYNLEGTKIKQET